MHNKKDSDGNEKYFIRDKFGRLSPQQWGIYSTTGYGKSLVEEGLAEAYYNEGFVCIYLGDGMKNQEEGAYAMFEPTEKFHFKVLEAEGKIPRKVPVKLYHGFTFSLPKTKIPNYNIFTIPIKSLLRSDFSMLAETKSDSNTIKIMTQASQNLSSEAGLHQWLWDIYKIVKKGDYSVSDASKNFYIPIKSGNVKDMTAITNLFQPFKVDYFLSKENSKINLNFKEILQDNKHIHYFSTKYLKDSKMKEFMILIILNKLIEFEKSAKYPVVIIIPEILKLCPQEATGYQEYLSREVKESLSTMRNIGEGGYSSILSAQKWGGTDKEIRDSHSIVLLGKLSMGDVEKISKIMNLDGDEKNALLKPGEARPWIVAGQKEEPLHFCYASWGHKEPKKGYRFETKFAEEYPEKMVSFYNLIQEKWKEYNDDEGKFKEVFKKIREAEKKQKEKPKKEDKSDEEKKKLKELKEIEKMKDYERAWNMKNEGLTLEDIGKKLGTSKDSIRRWIIKFEKIQNEQKM